ncbi:MAG: peptidoglycan DD-metalloendopeptidase family protein [candidate division WOR-3 bacterium]|nr:MAG: peptidoglycan DD-metalloendopeptidase family protein [candidate division WOR-3 bacterium]
MILLLIIATGWPLAPIDSTQPLGNNWGEYQFYGGFPYLHPGIDVMADTIHRPVYAVQSGVVKGWLTISGDYHWRLAIADYETNDSVEAWLYAHIDPYQDHKDVGETVTEGELIGYLVEWPITGFDHLHFARIKDAGAIWQYGDWAFVENPLLIIQPYDDTTKPVFEDAYSNDRFAFCQNNTSTYLQPSNLYGSVDIIAKIHDDVGLPLYNPVWERLIPYSISHEIRGVDTLPSTQSFIFCGVLDYTENVDVIYKDDAVCNTRGDYSHRDYYFIVSNTDGDSLIESTDAACAWETGSFTNGDYWVIVEACDAAGNIQRDSMLVTVANVGVEEQNDIVAARSLAVLPNPSVGFIAVDTERIFKIVDVSGRVVASGSGGSYMLAPGIYFILVEENDMTHSEKIIVVR